MDARSNTGGIIRLLEIIEKHPVAIAADFRKHYNLSIFEIGKTYTYKEAIHLTAALFNNTNSLTFAEYYSWDYPVSKEYLAVADLYDLTFAINSKKKNVKYPRPFKQKTEGTQNIGRTSKSREEIEKILQRMNPNRNSSK